ncbi:MAG: metal-sensitive transcriptional regulator [Thermoclostridium sp.]|nr:metal-sensitive transcriptional regulator [Thermoclostridium sp.]
MTSNEAVLFKESLLKRLKRIEGQVRGIQKMIQEDKDCIEILTQVAAIRSAIIKTGGLILENQTMACIEKTVSCEDKEKAMTELSENMKGLLKFID